MTPTRIRDIIHAGPCDIFFTPFGATTPVYIGPTADDFEFNFEYSWLEMKVAQYADYLMDAMNTGGSASCKFTALDTSKDKISMLIPRANAIKNGTTMEAVTFGSRPGWRLSEYGGELRIHPLAMPVGDNSYDIILYNAANRASLNLKMTNSDLWGLPCEFVPLIDDLRPDRDLLFRIGTDFNSGGASNNNRRIIAIWVTPNSPNATVGGTITFHANAARRKTRLVVVLTPLFVKIVGD